MSPSEQSVQDIGSWLEQLGLGRFTAAFEANGVDMGLLPDITNEDLKDLGVERLIDRKILLGAAAELRAGCTGAGQPLLSPELRPDAERRQLTVMFCDLVGSTELSARFDPEDYREVLTSFQDVCRKEIHAFDGFIARYMGDGILVYFGYPQAREDSPERAARAGLAIVDAMAQLTRQFGSRFGGEFAVRIGVATGPVVVGDIIGEGAAEEAAVVGETPNLAARLQSAASSNQVVVSDTTRQLLGALFEYEDRGRHLLKGLKGEVQIWQVLRESRVDSRFAARHAGRRVPLVGRREELEVLTRAWSASRYEHGQAVMIAGEAGIGKSRIVLELEHLLVDQGAPQPLRFQCSPFHTNSTLYPLLRQLLAAAEITPNDSQEAKLDKLERLLSDAVVGTSGIPPAQLLAPLLSIATDDRYAPSELSATRRKTMIFNAIHEWLARRSTATPFAVIIEDAHWIDPTTLELLEGVIAGLPGTRLMLVITHRPEFQYSWAAHAGVTSIRLEALQAEEVGELVESLTGDARLPAGALQEIQDKTDGVPLFVEELTRMLQERVRLSAVAGDGEPANSLSDIPTTIHDLLLARMDQLGAIKSLAQLAACFGRYFSRRRLALVAGKAPEDLRGELGQLVESGLVNAVEGRDGQYAFKHALIQETAYASLLRATRVIIHRRIAEALEQEAGAQNEPEVLAHHFGRARQFGKEVEYWRLAGLKAMAASAYVEARSHFQQALSAHARLPEADRHARELELQVLVAVPLTLTQGWASPAVGDAYARANALCQQTDDSPLLFPVLHGIFRYYLVMGNYETAMEIARRDLRRAEQTLDSGVILEFRLNLGVVNFYTGKLSACLPHFERCVSLYDIEAHADHVDAYAGCPATIALSHKANALAVLGRPHEAFQCNRRAAVFADRSKHSFSRIWAQSNHAMNCILYEDEIACRTLAEQMIAAAEEQGFGNWLAQAHVWLGWSQAFAGDVETGLANLRHGIELWDRSGARLMQPFYLVLLTECLLLADCAGEAGQVIEQCLGLMDETGENWVRPLAELRQVQAALALQQLDDAAATGRLLDIARLAGERDERLWVIGALRQIVQNARAKGDNVDPGPLREALVGFEGIADYPLLRQASELTT